MVAGPALAGIAFVLIIASCGRRVFGEAASSSQSSEKADCLTTRPNIALENFDVKPFDVQFGLDEFACQDVCRKSTSCKALLFQLAQGLSKCQLFDLKPAVAQLVEHESTPTSTTDYAEKSDACISASSSSSETFRDAAPVVRANDVSKPMGAALLVEPEPAGSVVLGGDNFSPDQNSVQALAPPPQTHQQISVPASPPQAAFGQAPGAILPQPMAPQPMAGDAAMSTGASMPTVGDAGWGPWTSWTPCSKCGDPQTRGRQCTAYGGCQAGAPQQTQYCTGAMYGCTTPAPAPPPPVWTNWTPYGSCSATCGSGTHSRSRTCQNGPGCPGEATQSEACQQPACAAWSQWGPYSACSVTCGSGGQQSRTRTCSVPGQCPGSASESQACQAGPCPSYAPWGAWSPCSATCGGGSMSRTRACTVSGQCSAMGAASESQQCAQSVCAQWGPWCPWSACSAPCGPGQQTRSRTCSGGTGCPGPSTDSQQCQMGPCYQAPATPQPNNYYNPQFATFYQARGRRKRHMSL